jgi:hypothetical protein
MEGVVNFELLKELVAFGSAVISFVSALSAGKTIKRADYPVDPLWWGALCFVMGASFVGTLLFVIREQNFISIGSEPIIQWGGVLGFLGSVLGLVTSLLMKKEVAEAVASGTVRSEDGTTPRIVYQYPKVIYVERHAYIPIDWTIIYITSIACFTGVVVLSFILMVIVRLNRGY